MAKKRCSSRFSISTTVVIESIAKILNTAIRYGAYRSVYRTAEIVSDMAIIVSELIAIFMRSVTYRMFPTFLTDIRNITTMFFTCYAELANHKKWRNHCDLIFHRHPLLYILPVCIYFEEIGRKVRRNVLNTR